MNEASVSADGTVRLERFDRVREWASLIDLASDYWRYERLTPDPPMILVG